MEDSDFAAAVAAAQEGRDDDHAHEFSEVIQRLSVILPTESTLWEDFSILCENYLHPLVWIPDSIDLAAQAAVTYWNRNPGDDPQPLRDFLDLLRDHPDGERIDEIAATATNFG